MKKFAICGISNSGKTTLFNGLTGLDNKVGNWYGVTTAMSQGDLKNSPEKIIICDLPGSYMNDSFTLEQGVAMDNIAKFDGVIVVCEGVNLKKSLKVLKIISKYNKHILFVVNMYGELLKRGGSIDFVKLQSLTNIRVVSGELNSKNGINIVKNALLNFEKVKTLPFDFNVDDVMNQCFKNPLNSKNSFIDKIMLNGYMFSIGFLLVFATFLYLSFGKYGIGNLLSQTIENLFIYAVNQPIEGLLTFLKCNSFTKSMICDGILQGVVQVAVFLPQLSLFTIFLYFIEESGVLARIAYFFNFIFSWAGLSGRAIFPFLSGYGCTAVGIFCCDGMENNCVKSRIINSLPFIPCSAKIPVIFFLLSVLKIKFAFLIIFAYYILSIGFALVLSFLVCKIKKIKAPLLIIEFPPYRFPSMRNILSKFYKFIKNFLLRIGSVVVVISGFLWLFLSVTPQFTVVEPGNINSFMGIFANKILFLFKPAGITDWRLLVGLIAGLFAKEGAISAFSIMNAENLTSQSIWCFIIFFCFYPPCLTTMLSILVKSGRKRALKVFMFYMIYAYLSSVVLNKLMINFIWGIIYLVILIAFVFIYIMLKSRYISKKAIKT